MPFDYNAGPGFGLGSMLGSHLYPATTAGWDATVQPTAQSAYPQMAGIMQGLQKIQGPGQVTPIMSGGVSGAQQAAQPQLAGLQANPVLQSLMSLIGAGGAAGRVPGLGALLRGGLMRV